MGSRKIWFAAILMVMLVAAGGVWWYVSVPHTPEQQFAAAEKLEKTLRTAAVSKTPQELAPQIEQTIEQFRRVWTRFGTGAKNPKAAEAMKRVTKIQEEIAKDDAKALTISSWI